MDKDKLERVKRLTGACAIAIGDVRRDGHTSVRHPETGDALLVQVDDAAGSALVKGISGAIIYRVNFKPKKSRSPGQ